MDTDSLADLEAPPLTLNVPAAGRDLSEKAPWCLGRPVALVLGLAGGLLLAGSLPPWPVATGAWPLAFVGVAMVSVALDGRGVRGRLACGLLAGIGLYLPGLWWMRDFSLPGYALATVVEAAMLAAGLALVPRHGAVRRAAALPAALVVVEAVRGVWPFGGFPLAGIELGQVGGPLAPTAAVGGRLLLVAAVGLGGAGLALLGRAATSSPVRDRDALVGAGALAMVLVLALAGRAAPDGSAAGSFRVAVVQGGGERGLRAVDSDAAATLAAHLGATGLVKGQVDLVLWPEDVVDVDGPVSGSEPESELRALADSLDATLVAGIVEDVGTDRFRNAAIAYGPDGAPLDRYDKVHLVPFGERIPWRGLVESLADVSAVPRDAIPGDGPGVLDTPTSRVGVVISYEVFFAGRARAAARAGGRVLLVPTNASSFADAQVPAQELAAARLRALETGRWTVQAAPTGYSAVVDHKGRVKAHTPLGDRAVLQETVGLRTGDTFATSLGPAPLFAAAFLALLLARLRPSAGPARFPFRRRGDAPAG